MSDPAVDSCPPPPEAPGTLLAPTQIALQPSADPPIRGAWALRPIDDAFVRLEAWLGRYLAPELNPLAQTGAIANISLFIATVSGVVLMIWYRPSVHQAYGTLLALQDQPFTGELIRSLHRYSSDAAMFVVLIHALRLFVQQRFTGSRWLAWATGILAVGVLWFVGWTGYWLMWDERAQLVAQKSALLLDELPIFADLFSRSFLADETVNTLLFFVVFFMHMLIPLVMLGLIWLHITRLQRPRFLTVKPLTWWVTLSLVAMSLVVPADLAERARLALVPHEVTLDLWYLAPLLLAERLSVGAQWALFVLPLPLLLAFPWAFAKKRARPSAVVTSRCDGCTTCATDCPYNAIKMVPHPNGEPGLECAEVDPDKCVGCGICAGSCNRAGVGLDWFAMLAQRNQLEKWLERAKSSGGGEAPWLALTCVESVGRGLEIDPATGRSAALPGYIVMNVPCAGWINAVTYERAAKRGAKGALVISCPPESCRYREGPKWAELRATGKHEPAPKLDAAGFPIHFVALAPGQQRKLATVAATLRATGKLDVPTRTRAKKLAVGAAAAALVAAPIVLASKWPVTLPEHPAAVVVSFKHPGQVSENCVELSADELAKLPPHMRKPKVCDRRRADVRLRVTVDGTLVFERAYPPRGIWGDGSSIALETIPLTAGSHQVKVEVSDSAQADEWTHVDERAIEAKARERRVVTFDKLKGFAWH